MALAVSLSGDLVPIPSAQSSGRLLVILSAPQTLSGSTPEKVHFDTVAIPHAGTYDSVNYRWTPVPSGASKNVYLYATIYNNEFEFSAIDAHIYKNGVEYARTRKLQDTTGQMSIAVSIVDLAAAGDYYEIWYDTDGAAREIQQVDQGTYFCGLVL